MSFKIETFSHLLVVVARVYHLDFVFSFCFLAVREYPDIGGYSRVVEELVRECDDGFEIVILTHPATYLTLTATSITREERRSIEDDTDTSTTLGWITHLRYHMLEEEELSIRTAWQSSTKTTSKSAVCFEFYTFLVLLPINTIRRIGKYIIKLQVQKLVS
jgi:hypothetical protein